MLELRSRKRRELPPSPMISQSRSSTECSGSSGRLGEHWTHSLEWSLAVHPEGMADSSRGSKQRADPRMVETVPCIPAGCQKSSIISQEPRCFLSSLQDAIHSRQHSGGRSIAETTGKVRNENRILKGCQKRWNDVRSGSKRSGIPAGCTALLQTFRGSPLRCDPRLLSAIPSG